MSVSLESFQVTDYRFTFSNTRFHVCAETVKLALGLSLPHNLNMLILDFSSGWKHLFVLIIETVHLLKVLTRLFQVKLTTAVCLETDELEKSEVSFLLYIPKSHVELTISGFTVFGAVWKWLSSSLADRSGGRGSRVQTVWEPSPFSKNTQKKNHKKKQTKQEVEGM